MVCEGMVCIFMTNVEPHSQDVNVDPCVCVVCAVSGEVSECGAGHIRLRETESRRFLLPSHHWQVRRGEPL